MAISSTVTKLLTILILGYISAIHASPDDLLESEIDQMLSGTGSDQTYIRIFDGLVPIPNDYAFDAVGIPYGISFKGKDGRILIGFYKEFKNDFLEWSKKDVVEETYYCGLSIKRHVSDDVESVLVNDKKMYMFFVTDNKNMWRASLKVYCMSREKSEKGSNKSPQSDALSRADGLNRYVYKGIKGSEYLIRPTAPATEPECYAAIKE